MASGNSRRLLLVDHLLEGIVGHHLGYNLALAGAVRKAGWNPVLVTHRDFDPGLAAGCDVRRIFHTDWRAAPPSWMVHYPQMLRLVEKISAKRFSRDLRRLAPIIVQDDVIFAQMIAPRHFLAWLDWMSANRGVPKLALHLGYQPSRFKHPAIRAALENLPRGTKNSLLFVTDSERLVEPFEAALGAGVAHLPHVVDRCFPSPSTREEGTPLRILSLGNARREKGFADIAIASGLLFRERQQGNIELIIQCHQPDVESSKALEGVADGPGLRWIRRPLSDDEYDIEMGKADVVLLPYHLDHYELRTSGVFCEARVAGKPVVGTTGSWLGGRIAQDGGGWLVPERDPAALADCLKSLAGDFASVSLEAVGLRDAATTEFCPRRFVSQLLDMCSKDKA